MQSPAFSPGFLFVGRYCAIRSFVSPVPILSNV